MLNLQLGQTKVDEMNDGLSPDVADKIVQLKDVLSQSSDAALACSGPSADPDQLQRRLIQALHANAPEPPPGSIVSKDDHRYDEAMGSYGHGLNVQVRRPLVPADVLTIQYSTNIECGADTMLLVYERRGTAWVQILRWQSPRLASISDAFGDFFVSAFIQRDSKGGEDEPAWRIAVAHGKPWCQSRFSAFDIDVLAPGPDPVSPRVLWHTERGYSRGDFAPSMKPVANGFELRLNDDCMSFDSDNCFERRVIYRYILDGAEHVRRLSPLALNARGFVEEWVRSPWLEASDLSSQEYAAELHEVHEQFDPPFKPNDTQFVTHSFGPVRACATPKTYQVQMNSDLQKIVVGKPGGESAPLASRYFMVREVKDGYVMVSAPTQPSLTCSGPNLMPSGQQ